jgi:hypothetical protein
VLFPICGDPLPPPGGVSGGYTTSTGSS